jgi:hypothetical protein
MDMDLSSQKTADLIYIREEASNSTRPLVVFCCHKFKLTDLQNCWLFKYFFSSVYWNTNFTFMWPCIVTNFFIIKPTRCTNFTNLFCHETTCFGQFFCPTLGVYSLYTQLWFAYNFRASWSCSKTVCTVPVWHIPLLSVQWINSWWWTDQLSETCRDSWQNEFVKLVHLDDFITKKNAGIQIRHRSPLCGGILKEFIQIA